MIKKKTKATILSKAKTKVKTKVKPKVKAKAKPKPPSRPYKRTTVKLSYDLVDSLKRELLLYKEEHYNRSSQPLVFLIGENKRHVAKEMVKLTTVDGGCDLMPSIPAGAFANAYITLAKRNLIPCAIARVSTYFASSEGIWDYDDGPAIFMENLSYILSYSEKNTVAQIIRSDAKSFDDYEDYDDYGDPTGVEFYDDVKTFKIQVVR